MHGSEWYVERIIGAGFSTGGAGRELTGGQAEPLCGCLDVAEDLRNGVDGIVVIDTRAEALYAAGHIPGAISLPHRLMDEAGTAQLDRQRCM